MQANQMQITDRMISILKNIDSKRSCFVHTEQLELSVATDESENETTQDHRKKQARQAVNQNKQESSDLQVQLDEISRILCVEPLNKEERAELERLRQKHRGRILNSANAEAWDVSEAVDRRYPQDIKQIMFELLNKTSQRDDTTLREELGQKFRKVQTQRCGEEQIEQVIHGIIGKEQSEQKDRERKRKENYFKKDWKRDKQRMIERAREAERWMQMEEKFEEMKREMDAEIYVMKQELEMERDRRKKIKKQARQKLQRLRERIRILKREIEEMKETEGLRKTKQNESSHCHYAPSEGGVKNARVGVDNKEGQKQKFKRHFMAVFAWILKGLRCVGSALALVYSYFCTLYCR
ncbi:uncharacterized protein LOC128510371 [Clarias gariepinus]|uniref:uncharacterized protein LOC128510371 n=1 Tax=Clarias gariepinus TaxID=13013 RepID=UPI00234CE509|nr:uncharacterized protein LOC128510371 [Clarias gariepinus]